MSAPDAVLSGLAELSSCATVQALLDRAVRLAVTLTGARLGYAALGHPERPSWWTATTDDAQRLELVRQRVSTGVVAEALRSGKTISSASAVDDPRFASRASVRKHAIQAVLCAPLGNSDAPGALYVEGRGSTGPFTEIEAGVLEHVARIAGRLARPLLLRVDSGADDPTATWRARLRAGSIVGRSRALADVLEKIAVVAPHRIPVFLTGPTGSGKSELARVIHESGPRGARPFVTVDCTRLRPDRAEADLFGAVRGAYTGLERTRDGALVSADGGTLFLDEVGELPTEVQSQLLVFLQSRSFRPMGSDRERDADVRVVAATSKEATELTAALYWRLAGMEIRVPGLAERREDVPRIAHALIARAAQHEQIRPLPLSDDAAEWLVHEEWPGNVRALERVVTRGLLWAHHERSAVIARRHVTDDSARSPEPPREVPEALEQAVALYRRRHCEVVLSRCGGNKRAAAARLGISRSTLYAILESDVSAAPDTVSERADTA